jgi:hypothetical protein
MWGGRLHAPADKPGVSAGRVHCNGNDRCCKQLGAESCDLNSGNEDRSSSVSSNAKAEFKEFSQAKSL